VTVEPVPVRLRVRNCLTHLSPTVALVAACAVACAGASAASVTAIVGATVLHPELEGAAAVARDNTILIIGNHISSVGPRGAARIPRDATVIEAHGKWVIPGIIDSHVHFFQSGDLYTRPDVVDLGTLVPYAEEVRRNQARLPETFRIYLASGVTSAADVGGPSGISTCVTRRARALLRRGSPSPGRSFP
jgi:imidazolonepropionase-like amidohydrolase